MYQRRAEIIFQVIRLTKGCRISQTRRRFRFFLFSEFVLTRR